jgi:hypothetical protein
MVPRFYVANDEIGRKGGREEKWRACPKESCRGNPQSSINVTI